MASSPSSSPFFPLLVTTKHLLNLLTNLPSLTSPTSTSTSNPNPNNLDPNSTNDCPNSNPDSKNNPFNLTQLQLLNLQNNLTNNLPSGKLSGRDEKNQVRAEIFDWLSEERERERVKGRGRVRGSREGGGNQEVGNEAGTGAGGAVGEQTVSIPRLTWLPRTHSTQNPSNTATTSSSPALSSRALLPLFQKLYNLTPPPTIPSLFSSSSTSSTNPNTIYNQLKSNCHSGISGLEMELDCLVRVLEIIIVLNSNGKKSGFGGGETNHHPRGEGEQGGKEEIGSSSQRQNQRLRNGNGNGDAIRNRVKVEDPEEVALPSLLNNNNNGSNSGPRGRRRDGNGDVTHNNRSGTSRDRDIDWERGEEAVAVISVLDDDDNWEEFESLVIWIGAFRKLVLKGLTEPLSKAEDHRRQSAAASIGSVTPTPVPPPGPAPDETSSGRSASAVANDLPKSSPTVPTSREVNSKNNATPTGTSSRKANIQLPQLFPRTTPTAGSSSQIQDLPRLSRPQPDTDVTRGMQIPQPQTNGGFTPRPLSQQQARAHPQPVSGAGLMPTAASNGWIPQAILQSLFHDASQLSSHVSGPATTAPFTPPNSMPTLHNYRPDLLPASTPATSSVQPTLMTAQSYLASQPLPRNASGGPNVGNFDVSSTQAQIIAQNWNNIIEPPQNQQQQQQHQLPPSLYNHPLGPYIHILSNDHMVRNIEGALREGTTAKYIYDRLMSNFQSVPDNLRPALEELVHQYVASRLKNAHSQVGGLPNTANNHNVVADLKSSVGGRRSNEVQPQAVQQVPATLRQTGPTASSSDHALASTSAAVGSRTQSTSQQAPRPSAATPPNNATSASRFNTAGSSATNQSGSSDLDIKIPSPEAVNFIRRRIAQLYPRGAPTGFEDAFMKFYATKAQERNPPNLKFFLGYLQQSPDTFRVSDPGVGVSVRDKSTGQHHSSSTPSVGGAPGSSFNTAHQLSLSQASRHTHPTNKFNPTSSSTPGAASSLVAPAPPSTAHQATIAHGVHSALGLTSRPATQAPPESSSHSEQVGASTSKVTLLDSKLPASISHARFGNNSGIPPASTYRVHKSPGILRQFSSQPTPRQSDQQHFPTGRSTPRATQGAISSSSSSTPIARSSPKPSVGFANSLPEKASGVEGLKRISTSPDESKKPILPQPKTSTPQSSSVLLLGNTDNSEDSNTVVSRGLGRKEPAEKERDNNENEDDDDDEDDDDEEFKEMFSWSKPSQTKSKGFQNHRPPTRLNAWNKTGKIPKVSSSPQRLSKFDASSWLEDQTFASDSSGVEEDYGIPSASAPARGIWPPTATTAIDAQPEASTSARLLSPVPTDLPPSITEPTTVDQPETLDEIGKEPHHSVPSDDPDEVVALNAEVDTSGPKNSGNQNQEADQDEIEINVPVHQNNEDNDMGQDENRRKGELMTLDSEDDVQYVDEDEELKDTSAQNGNVLGVGLGRVIWEPPGSPIERPYESTLESFGNWSHQRIPNPNPADPNWPGFLQRSRHLVFERMGEPPGGPQCIFRPVPKEVLATNGVTDEPQFVWVTDTYNFCPGSLGERLMVLGTEQGSKLRAQHRFNVVVERGENRWEYMGFYQVVYAGEMTRHDFENMEIEKQEAWINWFLTKKREPKAKDREAAENNVITGHAKAFVDKLVEEGHFSGPRKSSPSKMTGREFIKQLKAGLFVLDFWVCVLVGADKAFAEWFEDEYSGPRTMMHISPPKTSLKRTLTTILDESDEEERRATATPPARKRTRSSLTASQKSNASAGSSRVFRR